MKKLILTAIMLCTMGLSSPVVHAEQVDYTISEPTITKENGSVVYTMELAVDMPALYGYQIEVDALEDNIILQNQVEGIESPVVYKNEKQNLATMTGTTELSGTIVLCQITSSYPYQDKNKNRTDRKSVV